MHATEGVKVTVHGVPDSGAYPRCATHAVVGGLWWAWDGLLQASHQPEELSKPSCPPQVLRFKGFGGQVADCASVLSRRTRLGVLAPAVVRGGVPKAEDYTSRCGEQLEPAL